MWLEIHTLEEIKKFKTDRGSQSKKLFYAEVRRLRGEFKKQEN